MDIGVDQPRPRRTGADRIRALRERQRAAGAPTAGLFDRVLRTVIVENITHPGLTPAMAMSIARERLVRRGYSVDGVNKTISGLAGERR